MCVPTIEDVFWMIEFCCDKVQANQIFRRVMPRAGRLLDLAGASRACECATTMLRHCTHSSAFFPSFGFRMRVWSPVKISKAFGMFLAPLDTFTERIWLTSILSPPLWKRIHQIWSLRGKIIKKKTNIQTLKLCDESRYSMTQSGDWHKHSWRSRKVV